MKRFLSFILTLCIISSSVGTALAYEVSDVHNHIDMIIEDVDFDTFASGVSNLIDEYEDSIEGTFSESASVQFSNGDTTIEPASDSESTNRLIVKSEYAIDTLNAVGYVNGYDDLHILQFADYDDCLTAYEYYSELDYIEYVQEDGIVRETEITEEVFTESAVNYPTQYQSDCFGYSNAKQYMASGEVTVAVVDSGVANDHEMLVGRVEPTGFDSIDNTSCYDYRGHGTHVAGIIVANTKSNVTIKPYRVLNNAGEGTDTQVYLGIQAAIEDDVDIINLSLSKKGDSEILREVITEAYNAGITVVAAAGNNNDDLSGTTYSPSSFPEVICAVSIDTSNYKASTSNWGSTKDLSAPGVGILSSHLNNTYRVMSGTSMAAPFLSSAAAYLLAEDNTLTPDEVYESLYESSARGGGSHNIHYVVPGTGVNASKACATPVLTPASADFMGYINVSITCEQAGAEILYRTSDMANKTWLSYTGPILIEDTTTISAYAICAKYKDSVAVSETYSESAYDASWFEVDDNGFLTGYSGTETDISVPEYSDGIAITGIAATAFSGKENITSVTLSDYVTTIEDGAFADCVSLQSVVAPAVTALYETTFDGCASLQTLDAPSVTTINQGTFDDCKNLTTVNLNAIKDIHAGLFMNCTILKTLTLTDLQTIGDNAFYGCTAIVSLVLPAVTEIGNNAFNGCNSLKNITVPLLVTIGDGAFEGSGITSFSSVNVTQIGERAFYNTGIKTASFTKATTVGASAFENCEALTTVEMKTATNLGERTFAGCTALTTANLPLLCEIPSYCFYDCSLLSSVTYLDDSIKSVGDYAFYNCKSLEDIAFTSYNLDYLGKSAFRNCTGIKSASFYNSIDTINAYSFAGCTSLESVAIPSTVLTISEGAFNGCSGLKYVFYNKDETTWNTVYIDAYNTEITGACMHYSATGHSLKYQLNGATCTSEGSKVYTCNYCDYTKTVIISKLPHTGQVITVAATCTEDGHKTFVCNDCSYTDLRSVIPATGHTFNTTTVAATCTEDGYEANECTACGYKTENTIIPATGHDYSDEWTIDTPAACGNEGSKSRHCNVCGDKTDITVIPAVSSHAYSDVWTIDYNATCTEDGLKYRTCTVCGSGMETMVIYATGHSFSDEWDTIVLPDCEKEGSESRFCSKCGEEQYRSIAATGHDYSDEWTIDTQATCTVDGSKSRHCENCYGSIDVTAIPAIGHSYPSDWSAETEPTCSTPGTKSKTCNNCSYKLTEEIPTVDHIYSEEWTIDSQATCTEDGSMSRHCIYCDAKTDVTVISATVHDYSDEWTIDTPATCTEDGSKSHHCNNCDSITDVTVIAATGHTFINDVCLTCGYNSVFDIVLYSNYAVINKYRGSYTEVTIPAVYEGLPVTTINSSAFSGCTAITSVTIPDSVTSIGTNAFYGCKKLATITMSTNLKSIGDYAFYNCSALTDVALPDSLLTIGNTVFYGCKSLTQVIIPDSVTSIGNGVFSGCTKLTNIKLGNSITKLSNSMFYNCTSLESIKIPEGVTSIGTYTFNGCTNLESVALPKNITIGASAFASCSNLKYVFYNGSDDDWGVLSISSGNTTLTGAYIHYNATDHDFVYTVITEVTCTTDGLRQTTCNTCGLHIDSEVVPATGHNFSNGWETVVTPTCTSDGSKNATCSTCGETVIETIPAPGHTYPDEWTVIDATCTEDGLKTNTCSGCGNEITETIPAIGHNYPDEWTVIDATCTEDGSKTKVCSNCDDVISETIPAIGHNYPDEWTVVDATCTEDGSKTKVCSNCGDVISETIPAIGHNYPDEWTVIDATCTEDGSRTKICSNCGDVITETIPATGHNYPDEWVIDINATCTKSGSKSRHCTSCDNKTDITVIESTGHNYIVQSTNASHPHTISYKCSYCEDEKTEKPYINNCLYCNFTVTQTESNNYKLITYTGSQTDVIVPSAYNECSVNSIANGCFKGNSTITSIAIEDGLTTIGSLAFMNCTSLEKVTIPASVTSIGTQAFYGFTGTIYCTKGSIAHQYAVDNNIKYVLDTTDETQQPVQDTVDTQIDYDNLIIRTNVNSCKDVTEILGLSESTIAIAEASYIYGDIELYGTGTIITVFDGNKYIGEFTLIVNGDINGDSICDAIDAAQVANTSNGLKSLDGAYKMAADNNQDDVIDIEDYQAVVNRVVA